MKHLMCPCFWKQTSEDKLMNPTRYELHTTDADGNNPRTLAIVNRTRNNDWGCRLGCGTSEIFCRGDTAEDCMKEVNEQLGIVAITDREYVEFTERKLP